MTLNATLPHLDQRPVPDGPAASKTDLIFNEGIDLPHFASIVLVDSDDGRRSLVRYYEKFLALAGAADCGFILESPTWRGSRDWAAPLGYEEATLGRCERARGRAHARDQGHPRC